MQGGFWRAVIAVVHVVDDVGRVKRGTAHHSGPMGCGVLLSSSDTARDMVIDTTAHSHLPGNLAILVAPITQRILPDVPQTRRHCRVLARI
jgi:hypothetical protein